MTGPLDPELGWVLDYADLDAVMRPLVEHLDHHLLNEVPGLENPTAENIGRWLLEGAQKGLGSSCRDLPRALWVSRVVVYETDRHGVTVWAT